MIRNIEKYWAPISILLIVAIIVTLFLWPAITQSLMWIVIIAGIGVAVILAINRHYKSYTQIHHDRKKFMRNASLDVLGIFLAIGGAIWLAGIFASQVIPVASNAIESIKPGTGVVGGIITGVIIGLVIGLGVSVLMRWVWGRLMARLI